jgi:hypothetical protein
MVEKRGADGIISDTNSKEEEEKEKELEKT